MSRFRCTTFRINSGSTLVELIVILSILVFILGVCLPYTLNNLCKSECELKAIELSKSLRSNRLRAISTGENIYVDKYGTQVIFYPNGRCNDALFRIVDRKYSAEVSLRGFTGKVSYKIIKNYENNSSKCS